MKKIFLLACLTLSLSAAAGGDSLRFFAPAPAFHAGRFGAVAGGEAALYTASVIGLSQVWYVDYPRVGFHFFNDNPEWLGMDKIGHVMTSSTIGRYGMDLLRWSGVRPSRARWYGGSLGFAYLATLEVFDGFSQGWGFSWGDIGANATGAAFVIGQDALWQEQRFTLKYSFRNTGLSAYRPELLGDSPAQRLLKDYNSQTYWISFSPAAFSKEQCWWPRWLAVAAGYSGEGMTGGRENPPYVNAAGQTITFQRYREFSLSLDIDLSKIPTRSHVLKTVFESLGFLKIPAPGVVMGNGKMLGRVLCY